jgi:hypothetical protein
MRVNSKLIASIAIPVHLKGKQANIPSPNICMNCHSQIKEGTNTGTGEIAKIYAAIGFDPATSYLHGQTKAN